MNAILANDGADTVHQWLANAAILEDDAARRLVDELASEGVDIESVSAQVREALTVLARSGAIRFTEDGSTRGATLVPCRRDFELRSAVPADDSAYVMARLAYVHREDGTLIARHPAADCFVRLEDDEAAALLSQFRRPTSLASLSRPAAPEATRLVALFLRAEVIQAADVDGRTMDDDDSARCQWDFHDAVFQSRSRLGRTISPVGATWRFRGKMAQPQAVKAFPWTEHVLSLPRPDVDMLMRQDMPLTQAVETRRSSRHFSVVPLSAAELGHFLFRTVRLRGVIVGPEGDYTSRPHPGGGGIYENEIYVTVDRSLDIPRGFYYYDAARHALCLVRAPDTDTEGLLEEARMATAGICRPQMLLTIASRHNRFNWKYSGMSLAAQLKNVGVIYQTMYLVATAMGIGGCALGLGNTDRFLALTGLDWFEEGSVGEFLIGRLL